MKKEQQIIIDRINDLCKEKGIAYYTVVCNSDVPLTTLMHILDGSTKNPRIFTIIEICRGLEISLKDFFDTKEFDELMQI